MSKKRKVQEKLHNELDADQLKNRLQAEKEPRQTLSFYRYLPLANPAGLRDELYKSWSQLGVLGRIYLASEGINAQISLPRSNIEEFTTSLAEKFGEIPLKWAIEENTSFYKLIIKVKNQIVADGLPEGSYDLGNCGPHLDAEAFHEAMPSATIVDMRNSYESEVGRFEGAVCPDVETFREQLPLVRDMLRGKEDERILLYCTGGIRCEKTSAYLKHHGFKNVYQLKGGIIDYVRQVRENGLASRFLGKNFVFDARLGERVTADILSVCHQCGKPADQHINCGNDACHLLFIQCADCATTFNHCCSEACREIAKLPIEEQRILRRTKSTQQGASSL